MERKAKMARNGALIAGAGGLLLNGLWQARRMRRNPSQGFSWKELIRWGVQGAALGETLGGAMGTVAELMENVRERRKAKPDAHANGQGNGHAAVVQLEEEPTMSEAAMEICDDVITFLQRKLGTDLAEPPFIWGKEDTYAVMLKFHAGVEAAKLALFTAMGQFKDNRLEAMRRVGEGIELLFKEAGETFHVNVLSQDELAGEEAAEANVDVEEE